MQDDCVGFVERRAVGAGFPTGADSAVPLQLALGRGGIVNTVVRNLSYKK